MVLGSSELMNNYHTFWCRLCITLPYSYADVLHVDPRYLAYEKYTPLWDLKEKLQIFLLSLLGFGELKKKFVYLKIIFF